MDMFHTVQGSQESSGILEPYLYIKKDCGRCDGYVPHRARLRVCPSKDMVEHGGDRRLNQWRWKLRAGGSNALAQDRIDG
jgi:hypothetical protein